MSFLPRTFMGALYRAREHGDKSDLLSTRKTSYADRAGSITTQGLEVALRSMASFVS